MTVASTRALTSAVPGHRLAGAAGCITLLIAGLMMAAAVVPTSAMNVAIAAAAVHSF